MLRELANEGRQKSLLDCRADVLGTARRLEVKLKQPIHSGESLEAGAADFRKC